MLRAFVDEPALTREVLKDPASLRTVVDHVKATGTGLPKAEPTIEILEDEEHQSSKLVCKVATAGIAYELQVTLTSWSDRLTSVNAETGPSRSGWGNLRTRSRSRKVRFSRTARPSWYRLSWRKANRD